MYERGLNISVEPEGVATVSKVEGLARTAEFIWSADVKDGATVTLTCANGDGAEDLYLDGEFLDRTVGMERAVNGGAGMRKPKVVKREVQEEALVAAPMAKTNGVSAAPAKPKVPSSCLSFSSSWADVRFGRPTESSPSPLSQLPPLAPSPRPPLKPPPPRRSRVRRDRKSVV